MLWLSNPQKRIQSILIKIGRGRVSEANLTSLALLLNKEPSAVPEVIGVLTGILRGGNIKAYSSAITALNMVAEKDLELAAGSVDAVMNCIRRGEKEFREDWILGSLDILIKISQKYPERMGIAVSDLLMCLENIGAPVREKSYFLLALMAIMKPGVFSGHSKELVRVLNGLNMDERIYACRLIKKIAEKDPKIVEGAYDILEDLRLNHVDSNLRSEAAYAIEKLKVKENIIEKKPRRSSIKRAKPREKTKAGDLIKEGSGASDISFSELASLIVPNEKDIKDTLKGLGLNHLVKKK